MSRCCANKQRLIFQLNWNWQAERWHLRERIGRDARPVRPGAGRVVRVGNASRGVPTWLACA